MLPVFLGRVYYVMLNFNWNKLRKLRSCSNLKLAAQEGQVAPHGGTPPTCAGFRERLFAHFILR